jgi:hypothetical protein
MLTEDYANVKDQVAPCGIRCGECDLGNGSVAETASKLMKYIQRYEIPSWANALPGGNDVDFKRLDQDLVWVGGSMRCPGCLQGGGDPDCPIRSCSREKGFTSCAQCSDLKTCTKFDFLGEKGEMLKSGLSEL